MIYIKSGVSDQIEPILMYTQFAKINELNGELSISFISLDTRTNEGHKYLREESLLIHEDNDYRVKQVRKMPNFTEVTAYSTYFDLGNERKYDTFGGQRTLKEFVTYTLSQTGWTAIIEDDIAQKSVFINDFGKDNVLVLINTICTAFDVEREILSNNRIRFKKRVGVDIDTSFRYGKNIATISYNVDTTELATVIKGFGADGLEVTYTSPNVSKFGERHAEPIADERFTIAANLLEHIKAELIDYPQTTIEIDLVALEGVGVGDIVTLIHEPLGIDYDTRVLSVTERIPTHKSTVVIGTAPVQKLSDSITDGEANAKEESKRTQSRFEMTDDQIVLAVEHINEVEASLTIRANQIEALVIDSVADLEASITIQAGQIDLLITGQNNQQSSITQLLDEIELKVDNDGIIAAINISPETIDINASKINLTGAVMVDGSISGATTITVTSNIKIGHIIEFADFTTISTVDGSMYIMAFNDLYYQALRHNFVGTVDLSNASVIGLDDYVTTGTNGLGLAYSAGSGRLYVRINGNDVGHVILDN